MNKDIREARKFGIVLSVVLIVIGVVIPTLRKTNIHFWAVYLSGTVFVLGVFFTKFFVPVFKTWMKIAYLIGKIISSLILGIFFYLIITPVGLIMKCFGRDSLSKAWDKTTDSYWIKRDKKLSDPKRIEKQF
ncbi:MAG: SxtJ family membrane protein [Candidatus Omnitrophota bacterium]